MPVEVLLPVLFSAIAALFGLWSAFLVNRNRSLEKQIAELEQDSKSYLALVVLLKAGDEESIEKMRRQAARILQGQTGVDMGD